MGFYFILCNVHTTQGQGLLLGRMVLLFPVPFPVLQCVDYSPFPAHLPFPLIVVAIVVAV